MCVPDGRDYSRNTWINKGGGGREENKVMDVAKGLRSDVYSLVSLLE